MVITIQSLHSHVSESDRFFDKTNSKNSSKLGPKSIKNQSTIGSTKHPKNISKLDPKITQNGPQIAPKIVPKSILGPPWAQKCAKDGPREPLTTNFDDF